MPSFTSVVNQLEDPVFVDFWRQRVLLADASPSWTGVPSHVSIPLPSRTPSALPRQIIRLEFTPAAPARLRLTVSN